MPTDHSPQSFANTSAGGSRIARSSARRAEARALPAIRTNVELLRLLPSRASRQLLRDVESIAPDPSEPVLIVGPRGAGKTIVAGAIHELSPRNRRPFVKFDLANVSTELAGSELFGHLRGAFTGAVSDRKGAFGESDTGSLFLDELLKSSLEVQQRLLNVVEYGEVRRVGSDRLTPVDVRVIFATNTGEREIAKDQRLLPDLFGRLRSYVVHVAPLLHRRKDLLVLIDDALSVAAQAIHGRRPPELHKEVLELLVQHTWPDNVRELYSSVRRVILESRGARRITLDHCHPTLAFAARLGGRRRKRRKPAEIRDAIRLSDGDKPLAASIAGVSLSTIYRHCAELDDTT